MFYKNCSATFWEFTVTNLSLSPFLCLIQAVNAISDQDTFYDVTDCLEEQGMEKIIQRHMNKNGADLDLLEQFKIYECVLHHEDGDDNGPLQIENIR